MQTIPIDFSSSAPLPPIRAMQGDAYSRFVRFELWEGGAPYTIPEGAAYKIGYRLRGGLEGAYDTIPLPGGSSRPACVAEGSAITAELAEVLTVDGNTGQLVLVITGPEGYKIHSWEVPLLVGAASGAPATDPSLDGLGQLTTAAVAKAQAAQQAAEKASDSASESAAEAAESAANAAESEAAAAESARKAEASEPASAAQRAEAAAQQAQDSASQAQTARTGAENAAASAAESAQAAQEYLSIAARTVVREITVPAEGWFQDETAPLALDVAVEGAEESQIPLLALHPEALAGARDAGLYPVAQTRAGAVRLWAKRTPAAELPATLILLSGGGAGGLPIATANTLGGVMIGENVNVTSDGKISVKEIPVPAAEGVMREIVDRVFSEE